MQAVNVGKEPWLREAGAEECDVCVGRVAGGRWEVARWQRYFCFRSGSRRKAGILSPDVPVSGGDCGDVS